MKRSLIALSIFIFSFSAFSSNKGKLVFDLQTCYLQGLNYNGGLVSEKTQGIHILCSKIVGKQTTCYFYSGSVSAKPLGKKFAVERFIVIDMGTHRSFVNKNMTTEIHLFPNNKALQVSNAGVVGKGVVGKKSCAGDGSVI